MKVKGSKQNRKQEIDRNPCDHTSFFHSSVSQSVEKILSLISNMRTHTILLVLCRVSVSDY